MDPIHFTAARNSGLKETPANIDAFYEEHSFEGVHALVAGARALIAKARDLPRSIGNRPAFGNAEQRG